jgi:hypothetical protein
MKMKTVPVRGFCIPVHRVFTTIWSFGKTIEIPLIAGLGLNASSRHRVNQDAEIEKFDMKIKF